MKRSKARSSDFAPFFLKGIPSASLGSNGPHLAYHQTGDTIYRINPDIMADAAKVAFLAAYSWAARVENMLAQGIAVGLGTVGTGDGLQRVLNPRAHAHPLMTVQ